MGGGDLNLKKSWHPLLHSNQEKVWQAERKAIEEKKRFKELEKERKEERELQELRRLGGKRDDRVEWIYAAPAQGDGPSLEEQEAYLLGKKRVDQLFKEQDEKRLAALKASSAPGENGSEVGGGAINQFQALGNNANSVRDLAAKVREDPMLAIKKQELAALEAYRKDPARLRALHAAQQEKAEKAARKEERRRRREEKDSRRGDRINGKRSRSPSPYRERGREREYERPPPARYDDDRYRGRGRSPSRLPPRRIKREESPDGYRRAKWEGSPRSSAPLRVGPANGHGHRPRSPPRRPRSPPLQPRREFHHERPNGALPPDPDAAARLAAMSASATALQAQRRERLAEGDKRDIAKLESEEAERLRNAKIGDGASRFVRLETAKSGEAGLANALRGARAMGMRVERD